MKMKIEDFDPALRKAIELAAYRLNIDDDTEITQTDDHLYNIGDSKYYIIDSNESTEIVNEEAEEYLDELICSEVPKYWQDYIDKERWFEEHDYFTFDEVLERQFDYVNYIDEFNGFEFYEVEDNNV
jgi:hypothetical protein